MKLSRLTVLVAFVAFISLGLPDAVLGVAWPSMRAGFGKAVSYMGLVMVSGTVGYVLSSFAAPIASRAFGLANVLLGSTVLVTAALVAYATAPVFAAVCAAAWLMGVGSGAIDACLNGYAAERFPASFMSYLHGFYGVGATLGPFVMTLAVTHSTWRTGYGVLALGTTAMAGLFLLTRQTWQTHPVDGQPTHEDTPSLLATLKLARVWLRAAIFFVYCGIEVSTGQWLFSLFTESRHHAAEPSGMSVTAYWGLFTVGRFVLGTLAIKVAPARLVRLATWLIPLPIIALMLNLGPWPDYTAAALLGFLCAPIYPLMMSQTPAAVGMAYSRPTVALQVSAATIGVALFPPTAGILAKATSLEAVPVFVLALAGLLLLLTELTRAGALHVERAMSTTAPGPGSTAEVGEGDNHEVRVS